MQVPPTRWPSYNIESMTPLAVSPWKFFSTWRYQTPLWRRLPAFGRIYFQAVQKPCMDSYFLRCYKNTVLEKQCRTFHWRAILTLQRLLELYYFHICRAEFCRGIILSARWSITSATQRWKSSTKLKNLLFALQNIVNYQWKTTNTTSTHSNRAS